MIKITSVNNEGTLIERQYDNRTCKFSDMDGTPIVLDMYESFYYQMRREAMQEPLGEKEKVRIRYQENGKSFGNGKISKSTKSTAPKVLKISLGLACNYTCSYCKQALHVNEAEVSSMKDVDTFIANFDTWCTSPKDEPITVQLWGGEPFVYIAKLKKLVPFLQERFSKITLSILSNGSLLNEKNVEFVLENNIRLAISHDGEGQVTYRKEDPLAEGSETLKWIKYYISKSRHPLYVNMVITKQNCDLAGGVKWVKEKLGQKVQVGYEGIVSVEDEDQFDSDSLFSAEDYVMLANSVKNSIRNGSANNINPVGMKLKGVLDAWCTPNYLVEDEGLQKCGMDMEDTLAVNLVGDALLCHSISNKIGELSDFSSIQLFSDKSASHWSGKEECRTCPVLSLCRGSCMGQDSNAWYYTCNNEFQFNKAIFEGAFEYMFGESVVDISGDIVRPKLRKTIPISAGKKDSNPCSG